MAPRNQLQPPARTPNYLAQANKSFYGAKPRGDKGWQVPRGQISKIPAHKGPRRTLLPGS